MNSEQMQKYIKVREMLSDYSDWLHEHNYMDCDYYTEEPHAVDAFLETLDIDKLEP